MSSEDWRVKYRPNTLEEFAGNTETVEAFRKDITKKRAFLLHGPHGIGKTSLARIGAKEFLGVDDFNITEINASDDRGIDTVRTLMEKCGVHTPVNRVWILDEFQETTKAFQNAILKLLEEGSDKDHFFLCTTDPGKILKTVRSRCGDYPLYIPEDIDIKRRLRIIGKEEGFKISPDVTAKIIEKSEGHIRDAVGFLQSVSSMGEEEALKYLGKISGGESSNPAAYDLVKAIYNQQEKVVQSILKELKEAKEEPEGLRIFIMSYGSTKLLNKWDFDTAAIMENFEEPYFHEPTKWSKFILDCYRACQAGGDE